MRVLPGLGGYLVLTPLVLGGCALPSAESGADADAQQVRLTFSYTAEGGEGYLDQTLTIANEGGAAGAPDLDLTALGARGEELPDVDVVTAFGSDEGHQVVPAFTEVIEVLTFEGPGAADVVDVAVTVADPGTLDDDPPPANDIKIKRFDITGKTTSENTLGSVLVTNTYDEPIRVQVVGLELAPAEDGEPQHVQRVSELVGPLELAPGEKVRERVAERYRTRFFSSVRAFLVR